MDPQDTLENDRAERTILQYHNTQIQDIGQSPNQLLLHWFCDFPPSRPTGYTMNR